MVVFVLLVHRVHRSDRRAGAAGRDRDRFARPAAGLPHLVSAADLPTANGLLRLAEQLTITFGALIGGIVVAAAGPDPAYIVNAVSFAVSGLLLLRIPRALLQRGKAESRGHWHDVGEGFRLVLHSRPLLTDPLVNLAMLTVAFVNVSEIVLAKVSFDAGDFRFGLLWSANGLGAVMGHCSPRRGWNAAG